MSYKKTVRILPDEVWYGADIKFGFLLPYGRRGLGMRNTKVISSYNQATPLWVSSKGRYIWSEEGYRTVILAGCLFCFGGSREIRLYDGYATLKGAYLAASKAHFPPDGTMPNEIMFHTPQYCTWIQLDNNQTQERILEYAHGIIDAGMPAGELLVDDGWQENFGDWSFRKDRFPDPKGMMEELRSLGFRVILWICPFVSEKAATFDMLKKENFLVKTKNGDIARRKWWNGVDAVLDLSNPKAMDWFQSVADGLFQEFGVTGLKQDAGDAYYYKDDDRTFGNVSANGQCLLWAESARKYEFNELRACWKGGGWGVTQRLADKSHSWGFNGLAALVPQALLQGVSGYPFSCPDMIGGGQIEDFRKLGEKNYDNELIVRYAQCSALMPMMQYSLAVWKLKDEKTRTLCMQAAELHRSYSEVIVALARNAAKTGEPILRYLDYEFPNQGLAKVKDCFMLGGSYLVAPVLKKGARTRDVRLPEGNWKYLPDETLYDGGKTVTVPAPLEVLPVFELVRKDKGKETR